MNIHIKTPRNIFLDAALVLTSSWLSNPYKFGLLHHNHTKMLVNLLIHGFTSSTSKLNEKQWNSLFACYVVNKRNLRISINQSIFWTRLSLGGRGGSSSSWSLQASRSSPTKDRCSAGMPRRDQLRSST